MHVIIDYGGWNSSFVSPLDGHRAFRACFARKFAALAEALLFAEGMEARGELREGRWRAYPLDDPAVERAEAAHSHHHSPIEP